MRVIVWNMSHWQKTDQQRAAAWEAVRDLGADIALLQEAVPPAGLENVVYRQIGGRRPWGSAIWGVNTEINAVTHASGRANTSPADLHQTLPGSVAVANVTMSTRPVTFVSMYGVIDNGYADTTVHRQLSDLAPLFDDPHLGKNVILGGDLNITTQWTGTDARYRDWEITTLARIKAFGLTDCLDIMRPDGPLPGCDCPDGDGCRHIRTQHHPRSARPWQNDYAFASQALVGFGGITRAEVIDDPHLRTLSDHMPLLVNFTAF